MYTIHVFVQSLHDHVTCKYKPLYSLVVMLLHVHVHDMYRGSILLFTCSNHLKGEVIWTQVRCMSWVAVMSAHACTHVCSMASLYIVEAVLTYLHVLIILLACLNVPNADTCICSCHVHVHVHQSCSHNNMWLHVFSERTSIIINSLLRWPCCMYISYLVHHHVAQCTPVGAYHLLVCKCSSHNTC